MKNKYSTNLLILSFCLLVYLAWQTEATKTIKEAVEDHNNKRATNLTCHECHSEKDNACFNFTEYGDGFPGFPKSCGGEQQMCVVKKFAFTSTHGNGTTTKMNTFSVKRGCAKKCDDGCVVMGERTRLYVCSQCCSTSLCNIGSSSCSIHHLCRESFQYFNTFLPSLFAVTFRHFSPAVKTIGFLFLPQLV